MKIHDISQELFSCAVYPGDPAPKKETLASMKKGDAYNLTAFSMCAHNGTHVDAPAHFIENGQTVDNIPLKKFVGYAYVAEHSGTVGENDIRAILDEARSTSPEASMRILIKGKAELSAEAAKVLASEKIHLFGNESQTVGPENAPMEVHKILLGEEIVLLEGIRLSAVEKGVWFLFAAPLSLADAEGSPCRAVLVRF